MCHFGRGAQPRRRSVVSGLLALELTRQGVGLEALLGVLVLPEPTRGEVCLATPKPRPRTTRRALRTTLWFAVKRLQGPLRGLGTSWGPGRPGHAVCALPGAGLMRKSERLTSHSLPWNSGRKKMWNFKEGPWLPGLAWARSVLGFRPELPWARGSPSRGHAGSVPPLPPPDVGAIERSGLAPHSFGGCIYGQGHA